LPEKTYRPTNDAFASCFTHSISWSISAAAALRAACPAESLAPWTARSRARCTASVIFDIAESVTLCHAVASPTLRWYCWVPAMSVRRLSARLVPYGSSDGRVICLPDDMRCWVFESRCETSLRSFSTDREIMLLVILVLIRDPRSRCG